MPENTNEQLIDTIGIVLNENIVKSEFKKNFLYDDDKI